MFRFLHRYQHHHHHFRTRDPKLHLQALIVIDHQNPHLRSFSQTPSNGGTKPISPTTDSTKPSLKTIDYLQNSFGLTPKSAISVAKKITLVSTKKPDAVLAFFQDHGFTRTQIAGIIRKAPLFLISNPYKTLKPKLEFLQGLGISDPELRRAISLDPMLLYRSVRNQYIPSVNFLKTFLHTDEGVLKAFKRTTFIFSCNLASVMKPNIKILRNHGVSDPIIAKLLETQPRTLMMNEERFTRITDEMKQIGFDPLSPLFVYAIGTVAGISSSRWEKKVEVFKEFGFSDEEFLRLFKRQPTCLNVSEEKIRSGLEFFVNRLKMRPAEIALYPPLICFSMEKRVKPRCAVVEMLNAKGLMKKKISISTILNLKEEKFLQRFVVKFQQRVPQLVKVYKGMEDSNSKVIELEGRECEVVNC